MRISFCKVFFLSYLLTYAKSEELHCSKYDFEEKVLEKMVRIEFQMERMKSEMEQTVKSVDRKLNEMDEKEAKLSYTIKTTQEVLSEKMEALQNKTVESVDLKLNEMDEKEAKSSNTIKTTQEKLSEKIEALQNKTTEVIDTKLKELQILKDQIVTPTVAFKARLDTNTAAPVGQIIVFPVVLFNKGDAYSTQTGKFTATTNGTYLFTVALCVHNMKYLHVDIMVDGVAYTRTYIHDNDYVDCHTTDTVAVLKAGQNVWVQPSGSASGSIIRHSSFAWNTFSGVLLHK
ncbi:heavy metal-binding protein HIP-like [Ruditapes philippinarum]|uniref:heavy metal-binding protein HIP-like n=1 Tax=Ruditapes philippinarum TaxID=129788 RepID=UPI00295A88DF|nr:heavy metal-binding protein HIP-like [Ruditapes philippinarum]